ncbi:MAG: hypothetical protein CL823_05660 [Crocinitomicaceae bacterium]|nr:hypothetical protein [Crocinitomicaceae bacterium]
MLIIHSVFCFSQKTNSINIPIIDKSTSAVKSPENNFPDSERKRTQQSVAEFKKILENYELLISTCEAENQHLIDSLSNVLDNNKLFDQNTSLQQENLALKDSLVDYTQRSNKIIEASENKTNNLQTDKIELESKIVQLNNKIESEKSLNVQLLISLFENVNFNYENINIYAPADESYPKIVIVLEEMSGEIKLDDDVVNKLNNYKKDFKVIYDVKKSLSEKKVYFNEELSDNLSENLSAITTESLMKETQRLKSILKFGRLIKYTSNISAFIDYFLSVTGENDEGLTLLYQSLDDEDLPRDYELNKYVSSDLESPFDLRYLVWLENSYNQSKILRKNLLKE